MQGVVLAAGEGTRMRPLTGDRPKGLVEVAGEPLLSYSFETLRSVGVEELLVVVGYRAEDIIDYYGDAYRDVPITYAHQREQLGLAHALLQVEPHVDGDFVAMNGDNVCRANVDELVERHQSTGADASLLVDRVSETQARTTAVFDFGDGPRPDERAGDTDTPDPVGIVEKPDEPPSRFSSRGIYVFSPTLFHACHLVQPSDRGEYELTDAIDLLLAAGRRVELLPLDGWCENVNTPDDVAAVAERLADD
ncbi:MAG: sugar phosphate nucleotidyltransferase [Haloarculaceae archaeon]